MVSSSKSSIHSRASATFMGSILSIPALLIACGSGDPSAPDATFPPDPTAGTRSTAGAGGAGSAGSSGGMIGSGGSMSGGTSGSGGSMPALCFGHPTPDEDPGVYGACKLERCCGSLASCAADSVCSSVYGCVQRAADQAAVNACVAPLDATQNIASALWFADLFSCDSLNCSEAAVKVPPVPDPCTQNATCSSCVNAAGRSQGGVTGNCGWMTDGTCHAGSTKGPDDPAAWGSDNRWTFFDDAGCPGAPKPSGCTADADCAHCEYCERSTGNCLTKVACH